MSEKRLLSLDELAAALSISPRTIRYYQTEGYLPPPVIRSRKAFYSTDHFARLRKILDQRSSKSLAEIVSGFSNQGESRVSEVGNAQDPRVEEIVRFMVAKGVEVLISPKKANLDENEMQQLLTKLSIAVNDPGNNGFSFFPATPDSTGRLLDELVGLGFTDSNFQILHPKHNESIQRHRDYVRSVKAFRADSNNAEINHRLQYVLHLAKEANKQRDNCDWEALARKAAQVVPLRRLG